VSVSMSSRFTTWQGRRTLECMNPAENHRNAIGYVISDGAKGEVAKPSIVWGSRPDGSRVFIDRAHRGASEGLRCACGSSLVARKGEVNAWHFAHAANAVAACEVAFSHALGEFASEVILNTGIFVPTSAQSFLWQPRLITFDRINGGVVLRSRRPPDQLDVYIIKKNQNLSRHLEVQKTAGVSALCVELHGALHSSDEGLASAINSHCKRAYLYNRRGPVEQPLKKGRLVQEGTENEDAAARLERLYPADLERRRLEIKRRR